MSVAVLYAPPPPNQYRCVFVSGVILEFALYRSTQQPCVANTRPRPNVVLLLVHRHRCRPNIKTILARRLLFAG